MPIFRFFVLWWLVLLAGCLSVKPAAAEDLYTIVAPKKFATFHNYPVPIVIGLGSKARPETFSAILNGIDITDKFKSTPKGLEAYVTPEEGVRVNLSTELLEQINVLKTRIKGTASEQYIVIETNFFVQADQVATVGPEGKIINSLDDAFSLDIPPNALEAPTTFALYSVKNSQGIGNIYQISPEELRLNKPARVTIRYKREQLPEDVDENDLIPLTGKRFPGKIADIFIDRLNHNVSGAVDTISWYFLSYREDIGKTVKDIPVANAFRLPIGDTSDPYYSCGKEYSLPTEKDKGEYLSLLHINPASDDTSKDASHPLAVFNAQDSSNTWEMRSGLNSKIESHNIDDPSYDSDTLIPVNRDIYNNGTDWYFKGSGQRHQRLPIHAVADGLVVHSGKDTLVIAHNTSSGIIMSVYSNLDEQSLCGPGSIVKRGNIIGTIGSPMTKDPHLHFAMTKEDEVRVDLISGKIFAPAFWYSVWTKEEISENFYDPLAVITNQNSNYAWEFETAGYDEGWRVSSLDQKKDIQAHVADGHFNVPPDSGSFVVTSYPLKLDAKTFSTIHLSLQSSNLSLRGKVFYTTTELKDFSEKKSVDFDILSDGQLHDYAIPLDQQREWEGIITGIRFQFKESGTSPQQGVSIDSIRLGRPYLSLLSDTGQRKCYDNMKEIQCPGKDSAFYGQDGNFITIPPNYSEKTINNDPVVHDNISDLTWQKTNDGNQYVWDEALDHAEKATYAGFSDWRLPTLQEFQSISNEGCLRSGIDIENVLAGKTATAKVKKPASADDEEDDEGEDDDEDDDSANDDKAPAVSEAATPAKPPLDCFPYGEKEGLCYWTSNSPGYLYPEAQLYCFDKNQTVSVPKKEKHSILLVRGKKLEPGFFRDNGDSTVTDITTDLMWQQTEVKSRTWEEALTYCKDLRLGGYNDWRLPTLKELSTLVDNRYVDPTTNSTFFYGMRSAGYWSSTTNTIYPDFAYVVQFDDGIEHNGQKGRRYFVKAVRDVYYVNREAPIIKLLEEKAATTTKVEKSPVGKVQDEEDEEEDEVEEEKVQEAVTPEQPVESIEPRPLQPQTQKDEEDEDDGDTDNEKDKRWNLNMGM